MQPGDSVEVTIRNHRYLRWSPIAYFSMSLLFAVGVAIVIQRTIGFSIISFCIILVIGFLAGLLSTRLWSQFMVPGLKLTDVLRTYSGGLAIHPSSIRLIEFAHSSGEDYDDSTPTVALCEVRIRRRCLSMKITTSVQDGRQLREWAMREAIDVLDPTNVLSDVPPLASGDAAERAEL